VGLITLIPLDPSGLRLERNSVTNLTSALYDLQEGNSRNQYQILDGVLLALSSLKIVQVF